jgi:hypothetical protein
MPNIRHSFVSSKSDASDATLVRPSNWNEKLEYTNDAGAPSGTDALIREALTAGRTYYVRTDGNDSNTGLVNNAGGAFLTIQKAWDTILVLDLMGQGVTIQIGAGTYTTGLSAVGVVPGLQDNLFVHIVGDEATPSNVLISTTSASCFQFGDSAGGNCKVQLSGVKMQTTTSGNAVEIYDGCNLSLGLVDFGACAGGSHVYFHTGGQITQYGGGYAVSGGALIHINLNGGGVAFLHGITITFSNAPAFVAFIQAAGCSVIYFDGNTFVNGGTVTGVRATITGASNLITGTTTLTYLPGNAVVQIQDAAYDAIASWQTYTPTVTSFSGTITSVTGAIGRWKKTGQRVDMDCQFTIATNGTGATFLQVTIPVPLGASSGTWVGTGQNNSTGKQLQAVLQSFSLSTLVLLRYYDGTYPAISGDFMYFTLSYETD